jgi:uncharacterized membrane-anchored protein
VWSRVRVKISPETVLKNKMINLLEKNRIISLIFTILIAAEIFFFSNKSFAPGAGGISLLPIVYHFVVFFLFSFFLLATIKGNKKLKISYLIIALILSIIYAILDEFHQSFVPGRNASMRDILTDSAGIILSLLIYFYTNKRNIKKKH